MEPVQSAGRLQYAAAQKSESQLKAPLPGEDSSLGDQANDVKQSATDSAASTDAVKISISEGTAPVSE